MCRHGIGEMFWANTTQLLVASLTVSNAHVQSVQIR